MKLQLGALLVSQELEPKRISVNTSCSEERIHKREKFVESVAALLPSWFGQRNKMHNQLCILLSFWMETSHFASNFEFFYMVSSDNPVSGVIISLR